MKTNHPRGLYVLFGTEMWERLSYYGMRSILMLYMVALPFNGGLGFDNAHAGLIYGRYTSSVYLLAIFGGLIADRFLGARLAVLVGGIIIASGHFSMAVPSLTSFYTGLVLIAVGTGLLKPNISTMVGGLYAQDDPRRDAGFSIFYMGINLGAIFAPFVCGTLAQAPAFKSWLVTMGINPEMSWHFGFAAAGVGMTLGLAQYLLQQKHLSHVGNRPEKRTSPGTPSAKIPLTRQEMGRLAVIVILFFFSAIFWMSFEQAGSSMNLFADQLTRTTLLGFSFPSSWFQSVNPILIVLLAPLFSMIWIRLGERQPSSPAKFACGLLLAGVSFLVLAWGSSFSDGGRVSPLWLLSVYLIQTVGELCLSPVGLSIVTKLAPIRMVGLMMGVWFLSISFGNYMAGWLTRFFTQDATQLVQFFGSVGLVTIAAALLLFVLIRPIRKLMCGVH